MDEILLAVVPVVVLVVGHELLWRRIDHKWLATAICAAAGYLFVVALGLTLFIHRGVASGQGTLVVEEVLDGFDAKGKLEPGDRIVGVDGVPLADDNLVEIINLKHGAPVTVDVIRGDVKQSVTITPKQDPGSGAWRVGIMKGFKPTYDHGLGRAFLRALSYPIEQVHQGVHELKLSFSPPAADPGGPKRMVEEFRRAFEASWLWLQLAMNWTTYLVVAMILADVVRAIIRRRS